MTQPKASFSARHPGLARFLRFNACNLFSSILQYLCFTFMPAMLGMDLAATEFMWPRLPLSLGGMEYTWNVLGYEVIRDAAGSAVIGGGLGYFISYETGALLTQCLNFVLQRNITFKSRGDWRIQAMWYFLAWVAISLACNAVNGLWLPLAQAHLAPAVYNLLVLAVTGLVSMLIFYFVFKIIFPEGRKA